MLFENVHACMCKEKNENGGDGDEIKVCGKTKWRKKERKKKSSKCIGEMLRSNVHCFCGFLLASISIPLPSLSLCV